MESTFWKDKRVVGIGRIISKQVPNGELVRLMVLEKKVGRTVTEEEVFNLTYPNFYQRRNESISELLAEQSMRGD